MPLVIFAIKQSVVIITGINLHTDHEYHEQVIKTFKKKEKAIDAAAFKEARKFKKALKK
jgi:hypothetical protein